MADEELELSEEESEDSTDVPVSDGQPSSLGIVQFGFHAKTGFNANIDLVQTRSDHLKPKLQPLHLDPWRRPPPDFRPQLFGPNPPKRNAQESMQPWKYGTIPGQRQSYSRPKRQSLVLQGVLDGAKSEEDPFLTRFRAPDSYEAKLMFVKDGRFPLGRYATPTPHDFRGYPPIKSLGLPEFITAHDHDPYNIAFKSERLNIYHGLNTEPPTDRHLGRQMAPVLPPQPYWESRLILPNSPWPRRPASFTRFRRQGRPPHSAFMDRVEETLTAKWAKEKLEKSLQKSDERQGQFVS
ncbi:uncharacterized protein LOC135478043 [Liolophura sinensis]|uniref:uncharacterized protein LOC135478043 n=1 Tax=Liolophura sinensis TaxID=3198878 RepID=UPI003158D658